jgi:hypothetical protein
MPFSSRNPGSRSGRRRGRRRRSPHLRLVWTAWLTAGLIVLGCALRADRRATTATPAKPAVVAMPTRQDPNLPLRIGAWNIEWLGEPQNRSGPARNHQQSPEDLADYILAAGVDVLGLAEIRQDDPAGGMTSSILTAALERVGAQTTGSWRHRLFPARSGRNQLCGVAWDTTRVVAVGDPVLVPTPQQHSSQGKPLWSRPAYGQAFSAGPDLTDFVVVVVHLKSDFGGDFAEHRGEEAHWLLAGLPQAVRDPDILIIGDLNCDRHDEPAIRTLVAGGFVDLNAADQATHWRFGPLDRALVPADQPEFAAGPLEVFSTPYLESRGLSAEEFKVRFSDHYLVVTELRVLPDDD